MRYIDPSLSSTEAVVYRKSTNIDDEGTPVRLWEQVQEFKGGFGSLNTRREPVYGYGGQRAEAAISTMAELDIQIDDKVTINNEDWKVIGIAPTPITNRILLVRWDISNG